MKGAQHTMARSSSLRYLLLSGLLLPTVTSSRIRPRIAQTVASPTAESTVAASTTAAPTSTQDTPLVLLSLANSLISDQYSGQTIGNVRTLSWPTTVVAGGTTYTVDADSPLTVTGSPTAAASKSTKTSIDAQPTSTGEKAAAAPNNQAADKRLGIILGVVIGCIAVAMMGVIFFCLHRRKRDNGSFFLRRTTPSMRSDRSWLPGGNRPDTFGTTTYISTGQQNPYGQPNPYEPKYPEMNVITRRPTPPITAHPAYSNHTSSRSNSDENPFYTPMERSSPPELQHHEIDGQEIQQIELDHDVPHRRSSHSMRNSRPPTPFSPLEMMTQMPGPVHSRPQAHQNPFSSPEDDEADDIVSPILPPGRNPERRYSPMVHYPSWDEVSAFSFSGDERDARHEDGGDGWRPAREGRGDRYELA